MHIFFSLLLAVTPASAHSFRAFDAQVEVVTPTIAEILPEMEAAFATLHFGDLVVFDLDNTLFREAQMLGTDEWWSHATQQLTATGLTPREAANHLSQLNHSIKYASKMRLMEPGLPNIIKELQERGIWVMGLTARHPDLANSTLGHLAQLGIDLIGPFNPASLPKHFQPFPGHKFSWEGGIAFTDGSAKGPVFKAMLESIVYRPGRAIIFDDRIDHIRTLADALRELRIPGMAVHYLKSREELFIPEIADVQKAHFERTGEILSDRRARRRLDCSAALSVK